MHGIINVYKPCGMSSNFVLTILKRNLGLKKLGHLGTLDPLACGVLPVLVNKGTKLFDFYLNKTKIYRAVFTFGKETSTLDGEGEIVKKSKNIPSRLEIEQAILKFLGKSFQIPPKFSAKKVNGKKAYEIARNGESIELAPKEIEIFDFKLITQINRESFLFEIKCSSGTYIRSIARDLGKMLNSCAFMSALIRVDSGEFDILNSTFVKSLTNDNVFDKINKLEDLLLKFEHINLDKSFFKQVSNGVKIKVEKENKNNIIVFCDNQLIGIGNIVDGFLSIKTNLQN